MIKKILLLAITLTLTQTVYSDITKPAIDMAAANKAHEGVKANQKEQPFWSADQKQYAELEKKYKQAITDDPENKKNYAYLAGVYLTGNKTAKAIDAYQDAITKDSENPKLFAAISIAYLHQSKYSMAKSMADQALKLDPSLKQVMKINEYIQAKEDAIEAASKTPAIGKTPSLTGKGESLHGLAIPSALSEKPKDKIHTPN